MLGEKSDDDYDDICDDKEDLIAELVGIFQTVRIVMVPEASNLTDLFLQLIHQFIFWSNILCSSKTYHKL